jgi:glycosyltransferase involved in cell wall biosynthesis
MLTNMGTGSEPLRVLALANSEATECCTFARITTPLRFLEQQGNIKYTFVHLMPWNGVTTYRIMRELRRWDVIFLARPQQYIVLPIIREARRLGKPILIDIDDWLLDVPAEHPHAAFFKSRPRQEILRTALCAADAITTSTPVIANRCQALGLRTYLLPNAVDCTAFTRQARHDGLVTIAFCGTISHHTDVPLIAPGLQRILHTHSGSVRVVTVGCPIRELHGIPGYTHVDFVNAADYPQFLSNLRVDIGLAPLQDTPFNRAKSDIKYLEYSAVGAATLASPVFPYQSTIREDRGVLVSPNTHESWTDAVLRLVENHELRQHLASHAYEWVQRERSIAASAQGRHKLFQEYARRGSDSPVPTTRQLSSGYYERVLLNIIVRQLPYNVGQVRRLVENRIRQGFTRA